MKLYAILLVIACMTSALFAASASADTPGFFVRTHVDSAKTDYGMPIVTNEFDARLPKVKALNPAGKVGTAAVKPGKASKKAAVQFEGDLPAPRMQNISSCGILDAPNTIYRLTANITNISDNCFIIRARFITLDCQGHSITANPEGYAYGVQMDSVDGSGVVNCRINNFQGGIYFSNVTGGYAQNNTITIEDGQMKVGIELLSGSHNRVNGNSISTDYMGIFVSNSSQNSIIGNTLNTDTLAFFLDNGSNDNYAADNDVTSLNSNAIWTTENSGNTFVDNTATTEYTVQGWGPPAIAVTYCSNVVLRHNTGTSTHWPGIDVWPAYNVTMENNEGIGEAEDSSGIIAISISDSKISNNRGRGYVWGVYIGTSNDGGLSNVLLENNTGDSADMGFSIGGEDSRGITLDGNSGRGARGMLISGLAYADIINNSGTSDGSNYGIQISSTNNSVIADNAATSDQGFAMLMAISDNNDMSGNTLATNNSAGLYMVGSSHNLLRNNRISSISSVLVLASYDVIPTSHNTFAGNSIDAELGTAIGILDDLSTDNLFYGNNITGSTWVSDSSTGNFYNLSGQGNAYYFANGTPSWEVYNITDTNGDHYADVGSDLPFDSHIPEWMGYGADYHPYTLRTVNPAADVVKKNAEKAIVKKIAPQATEAAPEEIAAQPSMADERALETSVSSDAAPSAETSEKEISSSLP